jgi:hypothetical protein
MNWTLLVIGITFIGLSFAIHDIYKRLRKIESRLEIHKEMFTYHELRKDLFK